MGLADLHIHTTASDGRWTTGQIIRRAQEQHMSAIAITDHDTVAGLQELPALGACSPEVIPGIEFNTSQAGLEIHILGYFIDVGDHGLQ
ncbi:MAG: PHP domain-containing protein, partial [Bacillota bacterium]